MILLLAPGVLMGASPSDSVTSPGIGLLPLLGVGR